MSRLVSIITAVGPGAAHHLGDAHRSVRAQQLPAGWQLEWLVQHDGGSVDELRRHVPDDDPRVSLGRNRPGGPGTTRNMALARARGGLVKVLDADDELCPGTLARDIAVLTAQPDLGWTTSRALDRLPDGTTVASGDDCAPGRIRRGHLLQQWESHDHRLPVHPATLCVRRPLLEMLGGWMALPASEDTGLLLALNAVAAGWFTPDVGLLYRKWDGQLTAHALHTDPDERAARTALISRRARLLLAARAPESGDA